MAFPLALRTALAAFAVALAGDALAVPSCELNGRHVNPDNGQETEGKTGLMRCRDGDGGPVIREQELQQGRFMGVVRYFKDGAPEREYHVDARGNRDGLSREWAPSAPGGRPVLVREETYRDSRTVGIARSWHPNGQLRRVAAHADDGRERAVAEFTAEGRLADLRCAPQPLLAPHFDDKAACGHAGSLGTVTLYDGKGLPRARLVFEAGERRRSETLWDSGAVRELQEITGGGGVERTFAADGTLRREVRWATLPGERPRRITTLEQAFHESGKQVSEKRWRVGERGGELLSEASWYLNGQPKERTEYAALDGVAQRRETRFHDNGATAFEGAWRLESGSGRREAPVGTHRSFDAEGRVRSERMYDERGRVRRERELDEQGRVVRDDEVFEDGSRKAVGR